MLLPKRVKYRRVHRGRLKGKAMRGNTVTYGDFGLQATEPCWITSNQIEAARIAMTRYTKRGGKVWIKIFPDKPITEKPAETRIRVPWPSGTGCRRRARPCHKPRSLAFLGGLPARPCVWPPTSCLSSARSWRSRPPRPRMVVNEDEGY